MYGSPPFESGIESLKIAARLSAPELCFELGHASESRLLTLPRLLLTFPR
jgi:hypothetical protein